MGKQNAAHTHGGILFIHKNDQTLDQMCCNTDALANVNARRKQSGYMVSSLWGSYTLSKFIETGNTIVAMRQGQEGGGGEGGRGALTG